MWRLKKFVQEEYKDLLKEIKENEDLINRKAQKGRWTSKEHNRFIEGLKMFGKDWKKIEDHIGTRSGAQIRSHAQKFFLRLEKLPDKGLPLQEDESAANQNSNQKSSEDLEASEKAEEKQDQEEQNTQPQQPEHQIEEKSPVKEFPQEEPQTQPLNNNSASNIPFNILNPLLQAPQAFDQLMQMYALQISTNMLMNQNPMFMNPFANINSSPVNLMNFQNAAITNNTNININCAQNQPAVSGTKKRKGSFNLCQEERENNASKLKNLRKKVRTNYDSDSTQCPPTNNV